MSIWILRGNFQTALDPGIKFLETNHVKGQAGFHDAAIRVVKNAASL